MFMQDTYWRNKLIRRSNKRRRKTSLEKYICTSHFICKVRKGCSRFACEREMETEHNWNILTPKLWPSTLCLSRSSNAQPEVLGSTLLGAGFLYASSLDPNSSGLQAPSAWCGFPYHISPPTQLAATATGTQTPTLFCSIRQPYITFKLPRGDMDTPPRLRNFFWYLAIGMCHFRYLWNGLCDRHRAEITVMQFTGHSLPVHHSEVGPSPCPILSAEHTCAISFDYWPLGCVTSFRCITLE